MKSVVLLFILAVFTAGALTIAAAAPQEFSEAAGDSVGQATPEQGPSRQEIKDEMARIGTNRSSR